MVKPSTSQDLNITITQILRLPRGGGIKLVWQGTFDNLNPLTIKGISPLLLTSLVFQDIGEQTLDEPFSQYPSIAESFKVAKDKLSMEITVRKEAKFSDGRPITADDIIFSIKLVQSDKVPPHYKYYYSDIKAATKLSSHKVKLTFAKVNPELHLIATQITVMPKHIYGQGNFSKDFASKAVGSGPYIVDKFKRGSFITYKRNPNFWGKNLPMNQGRYNFDKITIKYFKDATAQVEAFKRGDIDFYQVFSSKVWGNQLVGEKFDKLKWIKKERWVHRGNQGSQGFLFNLRKKIFKDIRVRKAIALAFDFDWANKNLFYGQYKANASFFENSPLKATGLPTKEELAILNPLKKDLSSEVFSKEMGYVGKGLNIKQRLRLANKLLKEAGYKVVNQVATGPGGPLAFKFLIRGPGFQRIIEPYAKNLRRLGVKIEIDQKDQSVYVKRLSAREFNMIVSSIGQSQSPGNEQKDYWSSAAADQDHSRNYAGIKNQAVDTLIDKIIYAKTREALVLYTKCLDRVLYHMHILVHNWHADSHRVALWDKFARPKTIPRFYSPRQLLEFMWFDKTKAQKLAEAKRAGKAL